MIDSKTDDELGKDYIGCISAIKRQLNDAAGLDEEEATPFSGRIGGPEFETKRMGGTMAADARTTSASRAWRRSAEWLRKLRIACSSKERLAVSWRLFHYKHPRPDFAAATQNQTAAFAEFEAWRSVIGRTYLSDEWVDIFRNITLDKAKQQEAQAQRAQLLAWQSWMHEGPASGLRKQHQFTKVKGGWVEAAEVGPPQPQEDDQIIEEGVSLSKLRAAMQPAVSSKCPASLQADNTGSLGNAGVVVSYPNPTTPLYPGATVSLQAGKASGACSRPPAWPRVHTLAAGASSAFVWPPQALCGLCTHAAYMLVPTRA